MGIGWVGTGRNSLESGRGVQTPSAIPVAAPLHVSLAPTGEPSYPESFSPNHAFSSRSCSSVAIPGTASTDAVCTSVLPTRKVARGPATTRSQHMEPTLGPSTAPSTFFLLPKVPSPPSSPVEQPNTGNISLPIGKSQEVPFILAPSLLS